MTWLVSLFALLASATSYSTTLDYANRASIESEALSAKREIYIKLPASYDAETSRTFPVLYILHGQWNTLPAVATLSLLDGEIPEFIVVGVQGRGEELRPRSPEDANRTTPFSEFLHNELVPYVENNYRTAPYKLLSGHSNSGRFVVNAWLDDGDTFSAYYAFSPSMEDGAINQRVEQIGLRDLRRRSPLTVTIADEGKHMQEPFTRLTQQLLPKETGNTHFKRFPEQSHSTSRHASLMHALLTTFAGWKPSREVRTGGVAGLKQYYADLTERFGFKATPPLEMLQRLSAHYSISTDPDSAENTDKVVSYGLEQYPGNADAFIEIADYLSDNDYAQAGIKVKHAVCKLAPTNQACELAQKTSQNQGGSK